MEDVGPQISCDAVAAFDNLEWCTRFMSHKKLKNLDLDRFIGLQNPLVYVSAASDRASESGHLEHALSP